MPKIKDMTKTFVTKLQALYDIETQLEKALLKLGKAATSTDLKLAFREHLEETTEHKERLERIFKMMDESPKKLRSEGIRGIIMDGEWVSKKVEAIPAIKDAMIAAAARYAEHYEMAGYLSAITEANSLGMTDAAVLLTATLNEEMAADEKLSNMIAENLDQAS